MKQYHKNPRQMTKRQNDDLTRWLRELGDLSGIVHDLNSDEIIGGNQRGRIFDIDKCEIVLEHTQEPDEQGTVGLGYVIWEGKRYSYRQVRWTPEQCEQANIVANRTHASWDWDGLANGFNFDNLLEWGFDEKELLGSGLGEEGERESISYPGEIPEMELQPFESYDFIVLLFDNTLDWQRAIDLLGITKATVTISDKIKKTGIGRAIKGSFVLDRLQQIENDNATE